MTKEDLLKVKETFPDIDIENWMPYIYFMDINEDFEKKGEITPRTIIYNPSEKTIFQVIELEKEDKVIGAIVYFFTLLDKIQRKTEDDIKRYKYINEHAPNIKLMNRMKEAFSRGGNILTGTIFMMQELFNNGGHYEVPILDKFTMDNSILYKWLAKNRVAFKFGINIFKEGEFMIHHKDGQALLLIPMDESKLEHINLS